MGELHTACGILDREGFVSRPREELLAGARPLPRLTADPGACQLGWQYCASSASEHHFRENVTPIRLIFDSTQDLERGAVFHGAPTGLEFQVQPLHFHIFGLGTFSSLATRRASVVARMTCWAGTEPTCPRSRSGERRPQRTLQSWFAEKRGQRSDATSCCGT